VVAENDWADDFLFPLQPEPVANLGLASKYESWRLPLAVILVVRLCTLPAVTGMPNARLPLDIFVQIGLLVLIGLASKTAILIVEFFRQQHEEDRDLRDGSPEASKIRLRPSVMTSLAFILGVLPLVVAEGTGAEMQHSPGTAVFSGMIGVTGFGIFLTPVFFYALLWLRERRPAAPLWLRQGMAPATHDPKDGPAFKEGVRPSGNG
jgi:multidrug efflux pump